jgi:hypothetical protein
MFFFLYYEIIKITKVVTLRMDDEAPRRCNRTLFDSDNSDEDDAPERDENENLEGKILHDEQEQLHDDDELDQLENLSK